MDDNLPVLTTGGKTQKKSSVMSYEGKYREMKLQ